MGCKPFSIALLTQHFYPEMISTGMHMTELAFGLTRRGWCVSVYTAPPSWGSEQEIDAIPGRMEYEGIEIFRGLTVGSQRSGLSSRFLFAISYLLNAAWGVLHDSHRYQALMVTTNPPFIGLVGSLIKVLTGKPYLLIVYDVYPDIAVRLGVLKSNSLAARIWERMTRLALRNADCVVVIGRDMSEVIKTKLPKEHWKKIVLIPNWSDERRVVPVPQQRNTFVTENHLLDKFVVQYAGRMGRTHNIEPLLEAARLLADKPVLFQFVGDGAKRPLLQKMAEQMQLTNVQFLPYQPMSRLAEMLSAASLAVVCLDSRFTGLSVPSKTYGIMAAGKPILAFMDPDSEIARTITEYRCGIVMPNPSGESVANLLLDFVRNPDELSEMGRRGRDAFLSNFTLSHAVRRYESALCGMMEEGK